MYATSGRNISDSALINPGVIQTSDLTDNAVTDDKIAAHTTSKITLPVAQISGTIITSQITDEAVTNDKLADGTQGGVKYSGAGGEASELAAGTSGQFLKTQGAGANPIWADLPASGNDATVTAGEYLVAGKAVYIENASTASITALTIDTAGSNFFRLGELTGNQKRAQSFQIAAGAGVSSVKIYLTKDGTPADNLTVAIQADSAGAPSGSDLAAGTLAGGSIGAAADHTIALSAVVNILPATTYWIVFGRSGSVDAANYYDVGYNNANAYATYGEFVYGGATWAADADADVRGALLLITVAGRAYMSSAATAGQYEAFAGFVKTTANAGATVTITTSGPYDGLTGLTAGTPYYVSDTRGAIASSAGSNSRKAGIAYSSTGVAITNVW